MKKIVALTTWLAVAAACSDGTVRGPVGRTGGRDGGGRSDTGPRTDGGGGGGGDDTGGGPADTGYDAGGTPQDAGFDLTRDPNCPATAGWLVNVNGRVQTESGRALADAKAQLCLRLAPGGRLICLAPIDSRTDGTFDVAVPMNSRCASNGTMRVFFDGNYASHYYHVTLSPTQPLLQISAPIVMFETAPATTLPPLGNEMMMRTVVFSDGLEIDVVPFDLFGGDYTKLASARIPANAPGLDFLDGVGDLGNVIALYAFSPEATIGLANEAGYTMRVPNTTGLRAGERVNVKVLGGLGCTLFDGTEITEAEWATTGLATVNAGATSIVANAAAGLKCMNWLALTR